MKIGSRGSKLALWQANHVKDLLETRCGIQSSEIITIKTSGDKAKSESVQDIGGKAVFVKEIEEALLKKEIDLAIHSSKDMAAVSHPDLNCVAYLGGVSRQDALILPKGKTKEMLEVGARIGTGSPRRTAQLKVLNPKWKLEGIRGNIDTRIKKLDEGEYDAILLASAGLTRLGFEDRITYEYSIQEMVPCGGQGLLAVQVLKENLSRFENLKSLNESQASLTATIEFKILAVIGATCHTPVGVYVAPSGEKVQIDLFLADDLMENHIRLSESYSQSEDIASIVEQFTQKIREEWKSVLGKELILT